MKINESKITKLQAGGFMTYQPLPIAPESPQQVTAPGAEMPVEGQGQILDPDIFKKMIGEGISNDVMAFQQELEGAYSAYNSMSAFEKNTAKGQKLRSVLKGDLSSLNTLVRNKKQFDDLITNVKSQAAAGELAVTSRGMIVKDIKTGKVGEVDHEDYAKDLLAGEGRQYKALTNAELINEREYNKNLVNDDKSFEALNSAVGMTKIKDEVFQILSHVQSTSSKVTGNKYVDATGQKLSKGFEELIGMAQEGVYDIRQMKSSDSNSEQLKLAASAMWNNLSENSRSVLKARAASRGVAPDKINEEALSYAVSLLALNESHKTETSTDIKWDENLTKEKTGKSGADGKTGDYGYWSSVANSTSPKKDIVINAGTNYEYKAFASQTGGFMKDGNTPYGATTLSNITQLPGVADLNSVSFAGQIMDPSTLDAIVYTPSNITNLEMPFINEGGKIKPDFEMARQVGEADTQIRKLGGAATATARESIYRKHNVPTNGRGEANVVMQKFTSFPALANDRAIKNADPRFYTNASNSKDADAIAQLYERTYLYNGQATTKANKIDRPDWEGAHIWQGKADVLKAMVYIPLTGNPEAARFVDGQKVDVPKDMQSHQYLSNFAQHAQESTLGGNNGNGAKYAFPQ